MQKAISHRSVNFDCMTSGSQQSCSGIMFAIVMIATWAANLQVAAAAWTPHSFELRIHARRSPSAIAKLRPSDVREDTQRD